VPCTLQATQALAPGHLDDHQLAPFDDDIHRALVCIYERSLSSWRSGWEN
jgi:hypothetical protein